MSSELIFGLIPVNEIAHQIVKIDANAYLRFGNDAFGIEFSASEKTGTGKLLTIGCGHEMNVRLPRGPYNFAAQHCHFFLVDSGELILQDLSDGYTQIEVINGTPEEVALQRMPPKGTLRQRVIPRTTRQTHIFLGLHGNNDREEGRQYAEFCFEWNPVLLGNTQRLIQHAKHLRARGVPVLNPSGHLTVSEDGNLGRGTFTPTVRTITGQRKTVIEFHKCEILGQGSFGPVTKVVEYKTGDVWAMKEIKMERDGEKAWFKTNLQTISLVKHPNITRFELFQAPWHERGFQLFSKIYPGNINHLLASDGYNEQHECLGPRLPRRPRWANTMEKDILAALSHFHKLNMAHGNIKPENILFDENTDFMFPQYHFYLADFLLYPAHKPFAPSIYMAPEIFRPPETGDRPWEQPSGFISAGSDMYAFGITLGIVEGYWCPREINLSTEEWMQKLIANGVSQADQYKHWSSEKMLSVKFEQQWNQQSPKEGDRYLQERWCDHRVGSLRDVMHPKLQIFLNLRYSAEEASRCL